MLGTYLSDLALGYAAFRFVLALLTLLALAALWRRPRAGPVLALLVATHVACWAAYRAPLQRPYGVEGATDRSFNLGMSAATALGASPFEHTQVRMGSPEPLWNVVAAVLSGFDPARVALAWDVLTPLALLAVAWCIWVGWRSGGDGDGWESVMVAWAALGLSTLSMSPRAPVPPLWTANFMLKPHHAIALGLAAFVAARWSSEKPRPLVLGLLLGFLAWVFLVDWAYLMAGLVVATALLPGERASKARAMAVAIGAALALPLVLHLGRDFNPGQEHGSAVHMWSDILGKPLTVPTWSTLDLGPLGSLAAIGAFVMWRRGARRDRVLVGLLGTTFALWLTSIPATLAGVAPEPDELHYFLRFVCALAGGAALAAGARLVEESRGLVRGRGHLLALAACVPFSFPYYFDPPSMDRYFDVSLPPIPRRIVAYADFIRENTPGDAVFLAGPEAASYVPALTGRRVLLNDSGKLKPRDYEARKDAERILLTSTDRAVVAETLRRTGVTHLAVDPELERLYGVEAGDRGIYRTVFQNAGVRILVLRDPDDPRARRP